jgi:CDP-diacylglycerol pyrophosphatase
MNGNEKASEKAGGLPRRQFVRLSGAAGTAALLAGTGAGKNPAAATRSPRCGPRPKGAAACPTPSDICGHLTDTSTKGGPDKFLLWDKVQVAEGTKMSPPYPPVISLKTTPDYAILHGYPETDHNFLLVPSCRISGIECPFIWGSKAYPGYWNDAWEQAQPGGAAPVNYHSIGLGINSANTRQQDQLHIHMAGILSRVQAQLNKLEKAGKITSDRTKWPDQVVPVEGRDAKGMTVTRHYRALIFTDKSELKKNLFMLLGDHVPAAEKNKADQMMVVTPRSKGGFYILNSDPGVTGGGTGTADFLLVYA